MPVSTGGGVNSVEMKGEKPRETVTSSFRLMEAAQLLQQRNHLIGLMDNRIHQTVQGLVLKREQKKAVSKEKIFGGSSNQVWKKV